MATKRELLNAQLQSLDAKQGGIFSELKRGAVKDRRFLIVALGGTGGDGVFILKNKLQKYLSKKDYDERVRILYIDTDRTAQFEMVKAANGATVKGKERFTTNEFFWLENTQAKAELDTHSIYMAKWLNEKVPDLIRNNPSYMDGNGASGIRQIGRLLLSPARTIENLKAKVVNLAGQLTNDNHDALTVMVVSGISGGTGSGTVIDASYLLRYFIGDMTIKDRTKYCGFLLLPPTGKSTEVNAIEKGNSNGYAALKEIDYFMRLGELGEKYSVMLGGRTIESKSPIYDTCYLIDGVQGDVALGNPREKAYEIVSDCILDMVTSQPINAEGGAATQATVDSFMSDAATFARQMIGKNPEALAPRHASYVYSTIGHGTVLIPTELMKAFVAKKVLDRMYDSFMNHAKAGAAAAEQFIDASNVDGSDQERNRAMDAQLDMMFKDLGRGPFYVINMLYEVPRVCQRKADDIQGKLIYFGNKQEAIRRLHAIGSRSVMLNNEFFGIFVGSIEEMRKYLNQQYSILTKGELRKYGLTSTYTFTPVDFNGADRKSKVVIEYLSDLVDGNVVRKMATDLLKELIEHRMEWTDLRTDYDAGNAPKFDGTRRLRDFWVRGIGNIVNCTVEDYLIKLYSFDEDAADLDAEKEKAKRAAYREIMSPDGTMVVSPESDAALKKAAGAIVDYMWGAAGKATPLAELDISILNNSEFAGQKTLLIPEGCPHLHKYIVDALADRGITGVNVFTSFAQDRISSYSQYTGLPAFMFKWAQRAEKNYEHNIGAAQPGLHMSETKGGDLWRDFPNLTVRDNWPKMTTELHYTNPREASICESVDSLFTNAAALGLAIRKTDMPGAMYGYYELNALPAAFRPDTAKFKALDAETPGTEAWNMAKRELDAEVEACAKKIFGLNPAWASEEQLEKSGVFAKLESMKNTIVDGVTFEGFIAKPLNFTSVNTPLVTPIRDESWETKHASNLLRLCITYMNDIRGTVLVLNRAYELISGEQKVNDFAHYLVAGAFTYDDCVGQWRYVTDDGTEKVILEVPVADEYYLSLISEYALFQQFKQNYDVIKSGLHYAMQKKFYGDTLEKTRDLQRAFKQDGLDMSEKLTSRLKAGAGSTNQEDIIGSLAFQRTMLRAKQDPEAIKDFYLVLKDELRRLPNLSFYGPLNPDQF